MGPFMAKQHGVFVVQTILCGNHAVAAWSFKQKPAALPKLVDSHRYARPEYRGHARHDLDFFVTVGILPKRLRYDEMRFQ
jgi:hypothetical protein